MSDEPKIIVNPWSVVVDSREQAPWHFTGIEADQRDGGGMLIVPLVTGRSLATGDYSVEEFENELCIERKSASDWFHSIGHDRDRFEREMERMSEMKFAAVVIECDWSELLLNSRQYSQLNPKVTSRTIASWSMRFGVHFYPCMNRRHAELFTFQLLSQFWRQRQEEAKQMNEGAK